jgi:hypothetical protein
MKDRTYAVRVHPRRLLAVAAAVVLTMGLGGIALAASATSSSPVINGCFNKKTGALRVITAASPSCGSEPKISWSKAGPPGNGYAFVTTNGRLNTFGQDEADGPVINKKGTYFVNVNAHLNIASFTAGGSGFCALDLFKDPTFIFEIFSAWDYPGPGSNLNGEYPESTSGMVSAPGPGYQLILACFDNSFNSVQVSSATWLSSPVSATPSVTLGAPPAVTRHFGAGHIDFGGFRRGQR